MIVVADASAIVDILIGARNAPALRGRLFNRDVEVHAPHLLDIEVMHAIRRRFRIGETSTERAQQAISSFQILPIERHSHEILLDRIWQLRENLAAYDAAYVALAQILDTVVITTDPRLARAPGMSRYIHVVT